MQFPRQFEYLLTQRFRTRQANRGRSGDSNRVLPRQRRNRFATSRRPPQFHWGACCTFLMCAWIACCGIVVADPAVAPVASEKSLHIQQVFLPLEQLERWPLGDRQPMRLREFQALRKETLPRASRQPTQVTISHAAYSATLQDGKLKAGRLQLDVERTGSESQLLSLDPIGLALTDLRWQDGEAIWGSSPAGKTELLVDRPRGVLEGGWMLGGHALARGHEFRFQGVPATVGRLKLRIPADQEISVSGAEIVGTQPVEAGWHLCEVALGPTGLCQIFVRPVPAVQMTQPLTFVRQEFAYAVRQEGVRLQADFNIEVFRAPAKHVEFAIDPEIQVYSVLYGGDLPLTWHETEVGGNRRLSVELPDSILGQSRQIRLRGIIPMRIDQVWKIPRLRMVDAVFGSGQISLTVQAPLELKSLDTGGMRQTGVENATAENETLTFRQFQGDGSLTVQFGLPSLKVAARAFMDVEIQKDGWIARSQLEWTSRAGSVFALRCLIPEGWEITDVKQDATSSTGDINWSVLPRGDGSWLLELRFLESLSPEREKRVEVLARRPAILPDQPSPVPAFTPLDVDDLEMYVAISAENTVRPVLELGTTFEPIKPEDLTPNSFAADFWNRRLARRTTTPLLLKLSDLVPDGGFSLQSLQTPVDVDVRVRASLRQERMTEEVEVRVTPQHGRAERVLIHLSETGSPMIWRFPQPSQALLDATKLPVVRHAAWDLPPTGELWEIRLPIPPTEPFVLLGERSRGLPSEGRVGLAFVPQANTFEGTLEVTSEDLLAVQWQPRDLERADADASVSTSREGETSIQWKYDNAQASLRFRLPDDPGSPRPFVIHHLNLRTQFSLAGNAATSPVYDRCTAEYHLDGSPKDHEFTWTLPEDCEFLRASVDGVVVHVDRDGGHFRIAPLDFQARTISIQYQQVAATTFGPQNREIGVPHVDEPVLEFVWQLDLPPGALLGDYPAGMHVNGPRTAISWKKRFLGPLGQPITGKHVVQRVQHEKSVDGAGDTKQGLGWSEWTAVSPVVHERLKVRIWDARQALLLQWCSLLGTLCIGIVMRIIRLRGRGAIGVVVLVAALFASAYLPPVSAGIAGSCLLGTIFAMFVPRTIATRSFVPTPPVSDVPVGSTMSFRGPVIMLLLCFGGFSYALAQDAATLPTKSDSIGAAKLVEHQVLIPVDAEGKPIGSDPLVYVSPALVEKLKSLKQSPPIPTTYLLSSAEYKGDVDERDGLVILAKYRIHVLEPQKSATVRFPIQGASLGGTDACLLDGEPQPLINGRIPGEYLLTIPAAKLEPVSVIDDATESDGPNENGAPAAEEDENTDSEPDSEPGEEGIENSEVARLPRDYTVQLRLYPHVDVTETSAQTHFIVASLPSATLQLSFANPVQNVTLADFAGDTVLADDGLTALIQLGTLSDLNLAWSRQKSRPTPPARVEARALAVVNIHPSELLFQYQIHCSILEGKVDFLSWLLPEGAAIRVVSAPDLQNHSLQPTGNGEVVLLMDFARAQTDDFDVTLQFSLPNRGGPSTIELFPVRLAGGKGERTNIQLASHVWGIQTPSEFQVDPPMNVSESFASYSTEAFVQDSGLDIPQPTLAFKVQGPGVLRLPIKPLLPTLVVRTNSVGRIGTRGLQWNMTASVEVRTAAAFQHRLQVDPRLRILSISVQEDAANRLMRWTRLGDQVIVFLNGRSTGTQTLTLTGTMPLQVPQQFPLPDIRFQNATVADARLLLYQDSELAVELTNDQTLERLDATAEQRADGGRGLLIGRYRILSEKLEVGVRLTRNNPQLEYDSVTLLRARDARWRMTTTLVFRVKQGHGSHFLLRIPAELAQFEIDAADTRQLQERARDGSLRVLLLPNQPIRDQFVVNISGGVSIPLDAVWSPPEITPLNAQPNEHFLVISSAEALNVAEADQSGLEVTELPTELRRGMRIDELAAEEFVSYRGVMRPWGLTLHRSQQKLLEGRALLADTRIWLQKNGHLSGRSTFFLTPSDRDSIDVLFSTAPRVRSVLLDGRFVHAKQSINGDLQRLSIPLNTSQQGHLVSIFWEDDKPHRWQWLGKMTAEMPKLEHLPLEHNLLTIVPPEGILVRGTESLPALPRQELLLDRLETLIHLTQIQFDAGQAEQDGIRTAQLDELQRELETTALSNAQRARYTELEAILQKMREATGPDAVTTTANRVNEVFGVSEAFYFQPVGTDIPVEIWYASRPVLSLGTALLAAVAVFVIGLKLVGWNISATFQKYPAIVWTLLGLLWWFCLTPFWLAFGFWALGVFSLIPRRRTAPADESVDFILV